MEFLPEDPKKRVTVLVLLGVLAVAVGVVFYLQFGQGGPGTVEGGEERVDSGVQQPQPPELPGVRGRGGSRTATPGN
jgi:hypothetical protein